MTKRLLLSLASLALAAGTWACTNFIVAKNASTTGSCIVTYAADSYGLYGFLRFQPAADHAAGTTRKIIDWDTYRCLGEIPEVAHTYSVIGNVNEKQLTIGETTYGGRLELMDTTAILDYGSLIYIALERCATAREALRCMTDLVARYGYCSEGESFTLADPNEVWILEMIGKGPGVKGAVWAATRIPDDCISGHANQSRITTLPLRKAKAVKGNKQVMTNTVDGIEWYWSKDVISLAREKGYFAGEDADFSFADAYNPLDVIGAYGCEGRVWSFIRRFDPSFDQYLPYIMHQNNAHMPLYTKPNRKLSPADMRAAMRDQFEGTPLAIRQGEGAGMWKSKLRYGGLTFKVDSVEYCWPRPTATQQTGWSYVSEMHSDLPYATFWFGVDDAASNVYIPFFSCATSVPNCLKEGNGDLLTYSPTSAFWAFNLVANYAYTKYERMMPDILFRQQEWEHRFMADLPQLAAKTAAMQPAAAAQYLTTYSNTQAEAVVMDWHRLFEYLMVKYLDGVEKRQAEDGTFLRTPEGLSVSPNRLKPDSLWLDRFTKEAVH